MLTLHFLSRSRGAPFAGMSNGSASKLPWPLLLPPPPLLGRRASPPPDDDDSIPFRARSLAREAPTKTLNPGAANSGTASDLWDAGLMGRLPLGAGA